MGHLDGKGGLFIASFEGILCFTYHKLHTQTSEHINVIPMGISDGKDEHAERVKIVLCQFM